MFNRKNGSNHSSRIRLLSAVLAESIDLECVPRSFIVKLAADLLLRLVHFRRKEFHGAAAIGADHVVMTSAVVLMFVAGDAIVKSYFACQSTFCKKL
jgi:hypothetical protein